MDFMNLNQAAHGDREFAHVLTRMGAPRKTVAGHVSDPLVSTADRDVGACGTRAGGDPVAEARPFRRQHARRRGDRGRQGRGPDAFRRVRQHLWRQRSRRRGRGRRRRRRRRRSSPSTRTRTTSSTSCAAPASGTSRSATEHASSSACVRSSTAGGFRRVHHQLRGPRRAATATRTRRATTDGRRLRLRRRRRLEDVRHAPHAEGRRRRAARWHLVHGGLHVRPGAGQRTDPRRPHARGLPVDRVGATERSRSIRSRSATATTRCV